MFLLVKLYIFSFIEHCSNIGSKCTFLAWHHDQNLAPWLDRSQLHSQVTIFASTSDSCTLFVLCTTTFGSIYLVYQCDYGLYQDIWSISPHLTKSYTPINKLSIPILNIGLPSSTQLPVNIHPHMPSVFTETPWAPNVLIPKNPVSLQNLWGLHVQS